MKLFKYIIVHNILLFGLFTALVFLPGPVSAKVGVGIGAGEVRLTEPVIPGGIYTLPILRVFNTGDEITTYGMGIAYQQGYTELRPSKEWFNFSPNTFTIEPIKGQDISITMVVPVKAEPGDYFAYIESGPIKSNEPGTSVGIAVGEKVYFTIIPANIWQALMYRISSFFNTYSPWSWTSLILILLIIIVVLFRKFFSFQFAINKKE